MEPMYVVTSKYTYEEHKKAILFGLHATKQIRLGWIYIAIFCIALWVIGGYFIGYGTMTAGIVTGLVIVAIMVSRNIKKSYYSDKTRINREDTVSFYESFLKVEDARSYLKLKYDYIDEIWESETNFYIKYGLDGSISVIKENCTDELCEFIRNIKEHR